MFIVAQIPFLNYETYDLYIEVTNIPGVSSERDSGYVDPNEVKAAEFILSNIEF